MLAKMLWVAGLVTVLGIATSSPVCAQPAADGGRLLLLSSLYIEGSYNTAAYACSSRFPQERARWNESLTAWKQHHAATLVELRDLDAQLSAATRSAPETSGLTQQDLMALRTVGTVTLLGQLAAAQDAQASELCSKIRTRLDGDAQEKAAIEQAQAAARELLARMREKTR
jgi:hypothetical protein